MKRLTNAQELFCNKFVESGNASQAYRIAYPNSSSWLDKSVWQKACLMLSNVKVQARIDELKEELRKNSLISKNKILQEHAKIAFSSIAHLHKTWIERVDFEKLTQEQKDSIKSISTKIEKKTTKDGKIINVEFVKIELYDKLKALECLTRMLGYDAPQKIEMSGEIKKNIMIFNGKEVEI